ncbi:non-specific serine/threonine protein kinase [Balamuthia mandrillaris]
MLKIPREQTRERLASRGNVGVLKIGNYRLGKTLGLGSFGKVKVAEHEVTGHKVAVKILNRSKIKAIKNMDEKIRREIQILKLFRHPHIIKLYEVIETTSDIFMIMEYVSGGELFDYIVANGRLSEDEARKFFQQIISGVEYCHRHKIVHRDLKPENLLLDASQTSVKIADFGLSNFMEDGDFLKTSCGSPNYAAPEVISGQLYAGPEVDVWSCGVILYALVCARLPFDDENIPNLFKKIRTGSYTVPSHVSPACKNLIDSMLVVDSLQRATIEEVRQHPWFNVNLPSYLQYIPEKVDMHIDKIDEAVLQELLEKFGVSKEVALAALTEDGECSSPINRRDIAMSPRASSSSTSVSKQLKVAYHLIYDAKQIYKQTVPFSPPTSPALAPQSQDLSQTRAVPFPGDEEVVTRPRSYSASAKIINGSHNTRKMQWCLGVLCNKAPNDIMRIVFNVLKENGFEWKCVTNFQLRCRSVPTRREQKEVKVGIQLYKVKPGQYLIDFKKLGGDTFAFFNKCSDLLNSISANVSE